VRKVSERLLAAAKLAERLALSSSTCSTGSRQDGSPASNSDGSCVFLIVLCRRCHMKVHEFIWRVDET
jgi:hypothetical protein